MSRYFRDPLKDFCDWKLRGSNLTILKYIAFEALKVSSVEKKSFGLEPGASGSSFNCWYWKKNSFAWLQSESYHFWKWKKKKERFWIGNKRLNDIWKLAAFFIQANFMVIFFSSHTKPISKLVWVNNYFYSGN